MTAFLKFVAAVAIGAALTAAWMTRLGRAAAPPTVSALSTSYAGLTIERVRALSALTTLRVGVADALVSELRGGTGSLKAILIVRGEVCIGVDLSGARFESVDGPSRTARLVLPQPRLQSATLDHERTRLIGVFAEGLWTITPGGGDADAAAINRAYRDAQRALAGAAADPRLMGRTRQHAEEVLRALVESLGWNLTIEWTERTAPPGRTPAGRFRTVISARRALIVSFVSRQPLDSVSVSGFR